MTEALINPRILHWARARLDFDVTEVAERINQSESRVIAWEKGSKHPTFRQAQELARKLLIPLGYLYLSEPPEEKITIPDLRTFDANHTVEFSPDFLEILYDVTRKQEWYRDYLTEEGYEPLPFVAKYKSGSSSAEIARDIRNTVGITKELRTNVSSWRDYLTRLVQHADNAGILVMRSGVVKNNTHRKLSLKEFRGFAIIDDLAPVIFINSNDHIVSMIFTLAHELAHIWIGQSGISNIDLIITALEDQKKVEQLCNSIAAETLVPEVEFRTDWIHDRSLESNLDDLARRYRVSSIVILRRALELGAISINEFHVGLKFLREYEHPEKPRRQSAGGGFNTIRARNGISLTRSLVAATLERRVLYREALSLFGLKKASTILKLAEDLNLR